jgi:UV DNA damage endonuclease
VNNLMNCLSDVYNYIQGDFLMKVRFGYVSHALSLYNCSPAKTVTFTRWKAMRKQERKEKLIKVAKQNIMNTFRALHFNVGHEIPLYRMSSSIIPLATHPEVDFDYLMIFREQLKEIGDFVKKHNLRVSFHPNQFTLFTSDKKQITANAVLDMEYHYNILDTMGIAANSFINIHVGGAYGDKKTAVERFYENIKQLPLHIKLQMTLENDDKTYTATETLEVCEHENIPLIFDYHHHLANRSEEPLGDLLPKIYETWKNTPLNPKIHISSPRSEKEFRSHSDFVDVEFIKPFFEVAKSIDKDVDIMIEAKQKDKALLQLVEDLSKIRGYKRIGGGTLEL